MHQKLNFHIYICFCLFFFGGGDSVQQTSFRNYFFFLCNLIYSAWKWPSFLWENFHLQEKLFYSGSKAAFHLWCIYNAKMDPDFVFIIMTLTNLQCNTITSWTLFCVHLYVNMFMHAFWMNMIFLLEIFLNKQTFCYLNVWLLPVLSSGISHIKVAISIFNIIKFL